MDELPIEPALIEEIEAYIEPKAPLISFHTLLVNLRMNWWRQCP